ncbi:DUF1129 family protein [Lactobacillus sp. PV034]|uniref:DUF1129 family protein n=1 Tax=Lactobacillus sp. PV034 TaxID=2594495 RepID=UPI0022404D11|nr:DUF1129 family protein [Lactobacillus sp. PV034]QNQ81260.1 DUF1129 domain-containing protein [Lactobacillus sp. PV034]
MSEDKKDQTKPVEEANKAQGQEELKKQSKRAAYEEEIKHTAPEELRKKLTNKNSDYVFRLQKALLENENIANDQVEPAIDSILPEMIIAQQKGIPASTLYKMSPTEKAIELTHPKPKKVEQKFGLLVLDNILLYLALFAGVYGVVQVFSKTPSGAELGAVTLFVLVIGLGWMMAYYTRWMVTPKDKRMGTGKIVLIGIGVLIVMFLWVTATSLPGMRQLNPPLNPWAEIIIAVIAFGVRYYLRRRYNIIDPVKQAHLQDGKKQ